MSAANPPRIHATHISFPVVLFSPAIEVATICATPAGDYTTRFSKRLTQGNLKMLR